jgi:hypothetical protein
VKAGLVSRPEEWPWSSVHDYTGSVQRPVATPSGLAVDRVLLPAAVAKKKPQRNAKSAYLCATRFEEQVCASRLEAPTDATTQVWSAEPDNTSHAATRNCW